MKEVIACEIGNFDSKLIGEAYVKGLNKREDEKKDNEKLINILNIVSEGKDRRRYGNKKSSLINLLDVTIETHVKEANGRFFVGGLAFTEGGATTLKPTSEDKKSLNYLTVIHMLTTTAFYAHLENLDGGKWTKHIDLSTCLPTEEFFDEEEDYVDILTKKLRGQHKVKFNDEAFNGAEITLDIDEVLVNPEGTTAQIASTYNWNGDLLPDMKNYEYMTIINIDIGSIDVNVSILRNGEFLDKGFFGIKGGTTKVLRKIALDIKEQYKLEYTPDPHKIDYHLRTKVPYIIGAEEVKDLEEIAKKAYALEALFLSNTISMTLKDRGIEKAEINKCNMTGGGTTWMKTGFESKFKTSHLQVESPERPRSANAEGAYKAFVIGKLESEAANEEVFAQG